MQNFSEDYMLEHVLKGELRLPGGDALTLGIGAAFGRAVRYVPVRWRSTPRPQRMAYRPRWWRG